MITRDQIRRERLVAAILHEGRTMLIQEGRERTIIEAEEMKNFNRLSAGVRRLAFIAAVGTQGTTIEIEEAERVARNKILQNEEPSAFEKILDRVDDSLKEAYYRIEDRQYAYQTLKEIIFNEEDLDFCDICNEQYHEHIKIIEQMKTSLTRCLKVGQWRIERREECDLRWQMEEEEETEFIALSEEIREIIRTGNFEEGLEKYRPIFEKYDMITVEAQERESILENEKTEFKSSLEVEFTAIQNAWDVELEVCKTRMRRLSSLGSISQRSRSNGTSLSASPLLMSPVRRFNVGVQHQQQQQHQYQGATFHELNQRPVAAFWNNDGGGDNDEGERDDNNNNNNDNDSQQYEESTSISITMPKKLLLHGAASDDSAGVQPPAVAEVAADNLCDRNEIKNENLEGDVAVNIKKETGSSIVVDEPVSTSEILVVNSKKIDTGKKVEDHRPPSKRVIQFRKRIQAAWSSLEE